MLSKLETLKVSDASREANDHRLPSDAEIAGRVLEIRSGWDLNERISRREEAERRFNDLVRSLTESIAA